MFTFKKNKVLPGNILNGRPDSESLEYRTPARKDCKQKNKGIRFFWEPKEGFKTNALDLGTPTGKIESSPFVYPGRDSITFITQYPSIINFLVVKK